MFRFLFEQSSPPGLSARLSTLIFHRVRQEPDSLFPDEVDAARFDAICSWLAAWFNVLPLDEAVRRLLAGDLPARPLAITFDDGYADNYEVAAPILQRHGLVATFFIATGFLNGGRMWNDTLVEAVRLSPLPVLRLRDLCSDIGDLPLGNVAERRRAIQALIGSSKYMESRQRSQFVEAVAGRAEVVAPNNLMMTSAQVRSLHAGGMQIGAHTVTHPILRNLDRSIARAEIEDSRRTLESLLGEVIQLFAYPNGKPGEDYDEQSVELVREQGFLAAVSTEWGVSTRQTDPFQLRRFTPWDHSCTRFGWRLWRNATSGPRD